MDHPVDHFFAQPIVHRLAPSPPANGTFFAIQRDGCARENGG
jgi:hypothetical protein